MSPSQVLFAMTFTLIAFICDIRARRIPNWLNIVGFSAALVCGFFEKGYGGLLFSLQGFGVGFGILLLLWIMGGSGAGDVKFMGALGAWLGPYLTLIVFVASGFLSGIGQIVALAQYRKEAAVDMSAEPIHVANDSQRLSGTDHAMPTNANHQKIPYAVPVTVAVWVICGLKLMKFFNHMQS